MDTILDTQWLKTLIRFVKIQLDVAYLYFPYWLEFKDLLKLSIELVEVCSYILEQQLVEVLHAYVLIASAIVIV